MIDVQRRSESHRRRLGEDYIERALRVRPIAYWPQIELRGTVAHCVVNPEQDGAYSSDVAGWSRIPGVGGYTAPYFDGNDAINIQTPAFQAVFDGTEFSIVQWVQIGNVGVWTDGTRRESIRLIDTTDYLDYVWQSKSNANNQWYWQRVGNGVAKIISGASGAPLVWVCKAITCSEAADELKAFVNGVQFGATQHGLGAWAGTIDAAWIGDSNGAGANPWIGGIQHTMAFGRALPESELEYLAVAE